MAERFSVEEREGGKFVVLDNDPPKGSPFKDGVIYITESRKLADDHAEHLNRGPRRRRG